MLSASNLNKLFALTCFTIWLLLWLGNGQACAYIRDNGESSKGKKQKGVAKGGRKVVKRFAQQGEFVREDGPIEVKQNEHSDNFMRSSF